MVLYIFHFPSLMFTKHEIPFKNDLKIVSFDITNMYTNVPTKELIEIIKYLCKQNYLDKKTYKEIIKTCKLIIRQLFSTHEYTIYTNKRFSYGSTHLLHPLSNLPTVPTDHHDFQYSEKPPSNGVLQICRRHFNNI